MSDQGRASIEGAKIFTLPGQEPVTIRATPYVWRPGRELPRQKWIYGFELQRGHVSALVAPGAAGKSTLIMGRALCMASGRDILGHKVWNGPHRVWVWNLEDKRVHLERMLQAFCARHGLRAGDIEGRLFLDSSVLNSLDEGEYVPQVLKLATEAEGGGYRICVPVVEALIAELKARAIDHLDVDPFVSSHGVPENDNGAIDAVSKEWARVAAAANCSISLAHHVRKTNETATAFDARGAVALINTARSVPVVNKMSEEQAQNLGIILPERKLYFSLVDDKRNRAAPAFALEWYKLVGVDLENGDVGCPGPADNVAAVERFYPRDETLAGVSKADMLAIQFAIDREDKNEEAGRCRKDVQAARYVGKLVAKTLDLNWEDPADKTRVKNMVRLWLSNGMLRVVEGKDKRGDLRDFVVSGERVIID